jgi:hypothetical protein
LCGHERGPLMGYSAGEARGHAGSTVRPQPGGEELRGLPVACSQSLAAPPATGRAPETGEEGWCAGMLGAALWRRSFNRTPEACGNALAGKPKLWRRVVFEGRRCGRGG